MKLPTFGLRFVTFLLAFSASLTSGLRPICELPLSLLRVYRDTGAGHFEITLSLFAVLLRTIDTIQVWCRNGL
jgi:hypothetical protein